MTMYVRVLSIICAGWLTAACQLRSNESPLTLADKPLAAGTKLISFAAIKTAVLDLKCISCHGSAGAGGVNLSTYDSIKSNPGLVNPGDAQYSRLYTEVATGSMPDGGPALSAEEVAAIGNWIQNGAPNGNFAAGGVNPPAPPFVPPVNPPPTTSSNYAQLQTKLFDVSCVKCHSGSKPSGKVDLSDYQKIMANTKTVIVAGNPNASLAFTEITGGSMPPSGKAIDAVLVELLRKWIETGAKEKN